MVILDRHRADIFRIICHAGGSELTEYLCLVIFFEFPIRNSAGGFVALRFGERWFLLPAHRDSL